VDSSVQGYWNSGEKNRTVTRSSEKYPVRNISPSRNVKSDAVKQALMSTRGSSEVSISGIHELCLSQPESLEKFTRDRASPDLDNTQPIRDVNTSGYRSMSYLSRSPESDKSHVLKDGQKSPVSKSLPPTIFNNKFGKMEHTPKDVRNNSYKYISLMNSKGQNSGSTSVNVTSYLCDETTNSHLFDGSIELSEVGLNKLSTQPRPYNPPAERLISDDGESKSSSSCTTPNFDVNKPENKRDQGVIQNRATSGGKRFHRSPSNVDLVDSTPRKPLRSTKTKLADKSSKKLNSASRSVGNGPSSVKLLKPVAMCTRQTQIPSPSPFRDSKYS
jgi:hypothetical protein